MQRWFVLRTHAFVHMLRYLFTEEFVALLLMLFIITMPAAATTRLQDRGLFMYSATPGATTKYTVSFTYMTPESIGSVDMLFCNNPIPYEPCVTPTGLDVSHATLSEQSGETGFSILSQNTNHIILTRPSTMISGATAASTYTLSGIKNPTDTTQAFSIRLKTLDSEDGTGPQVDFGSVRGEVTTGIQIQTQVPPMLIFCAAEEVADNCTSTSDSHYRDMGQLSDKSTLTAQSQMAVGTNASGGFAITVNGTSMTAGTNVIDPSTVPTVSKPGTNQFGINLVENTLPSVGLDPQGTWTNALPTSGYNIPNRYKFVPGDVVASSPNVSLMKKFTVSYIVNSAPSLKAGVYSTTITYIASGRF